MSGGMTTPLNATNLSNINQGNLRVPFFISTEGKKYATRLCKFE